MVFESFASNLVPGDTNNEEDIFVRDQAGTTTRVSVAFTGAQANGSSGSCAISSDGGVVSFASAATNLVPGDTNGRNDIFVRDITGGTTELASVSSTGVQGAASSTSSSISADGRFVAFYGGATNLVPGDTNGTSDVFVHDRQTDATERASVASDGTQGTAMSTTPTATAVGRFKSLRTAASWSSGVSLPIWFVRRQRGFRRVRP